MLVLVSVYVLCGSDVRAVMYIAEMNVFFIMHIMK